MSAKFLKSLKFKALFLLYIFITVTSGVQLWLDIDYERHHLGQILQNKANLAASVQATAASLPLWNYDSAQLQQLINSLFADNDVYYVYITDSFGDVVAQMKTTSVVNEESGFLSVDRDINYETASSVNKKIGKIHIEFSKDSFQKHFAEVVENGLKRFIIVLLVMTIITYIIIRKFIARPTERLGDCMIRLAKGDLEVEIPEIHRQDEIGSMAKSVEVFKQNAQQKRLMEEKLRESNTRIKAALQARTEFLANMSHEIRTPMNGILGMTDLLGLTKLDEAQMSYVEKTKRCAESLLYILNDILDMTKIDAGEVNIEHVDFDLRKLVGDAIAIHEYHAESKNLELKAFINIDHDIKANGDPTRIKQVLTNLLNNAIKFTTKGFVHLSIELSDNKQEVIFSITDSGIGIPRDKLNNIFDRFIQADMSTTRKYGGTGLGLAISSKLVNLMGGHLSVESVENSGSVFTFSIPLEIAVYKLPQQVEKRSNSQLLEEMRFATGKSVLIVDDDIVNKEVVAALAEKLNCTTKVASNGLEALNQYKGDEFDLVIMDMQMPEMDGLDATREIRSYESSNQLKHTPIIGLTANAMKKHEEQCIEAGMDDYVTKPIDLDKLHSVITRWIKP